MSIRAPRRSFAAALALTLTTGLAVGAPLPPAHADNVINAYQADRLSQLWAKGQGPLTPGLTAGPEIGWNAGLEGMKPLDAQYYRLWDKKVAWRDVNPQRNEFDWTILDRRIGLVESWGGKPIMVLGLTPRWAAANPDAGDSRWGLGTASPPANIEDWRSYVRALVDRYGSRIGAYELWNEANLQTFWTGTVTQMADMVQVATEEIGNSAVVLAPSVTTRLAGGPKFTAELAATLDAETLNQIDAWSIHTYPAADAGPSIQEACEQRVDDIVRWQLALIDVANPAASLIKPIWDTEVNFGLAGPAQRPKTAWSDADGAALLTCTYQDSRALGIAVTAWYEQTAADYSLLGVQMNPTTPLINAAWAQLPQTVGATNPWIPDLSTAQAVGITIFGERATVKNRPGIRIEGTVTGVGEGTKLIPHIKFPGFTSYEMLPARPSTDANGEFTWERRTGKKTYVYFTIAGRDTKSNRIIIPAK